MNAKERGRAMAAPRGNGGTVGSSRGQTPGTPRGESWFAPRRIAWRVGSGLGEAGRGVRICQWLTGALLPVSRFSDPWATRESGGGYVPPVEANEGVSAMRSRTRRCGVGAGTLGQDALDGISSRPAHASGMSSVCNGVCGSGRYVVIERQEQAKGNLIAALG